MPPSQLCMWQPLETNRIGPLVALAFGMSGVATVIIPESTGETNQSHDNGKCSDDTAVRSHNGSGNYRRQLEKQIDAKVLTAVPRAAPETTGDTNTTGTRCARTEEQHRQLPVQLPQQNWENAATMAANAWGTEQ
jgi:hypothetical protein